MIDKNKLCSILISFNMSFFIVLTQAFVLYPGKGYTQAATRWFTEFKHSRDSIAIHGYDPVSYFTGNPVKGNGSIRCSHKAIIYYFATESNKNKFMEFPGRYEPEYGGWCAYAMGTKGDKVDVNPRTYKILNGKLYHFYNKYFNNILDSWNKDEKKLKHSFDTNWEKIIN